MNSIRKTSVKVFLKTFMFDRGGVTAIEYGLIAGLIAVAIIAAITTLGGSLGNLFNSISGNLSGA